MTKFIERSDRAALVGKDLNYSYNFLLGQIDLYASLLKNSGNQRVIIFSENRPEWIFALYAAWKENAIVVPVDVLSAVKDVAYIISDAKPAFIFTSREKSAVIYEALASVDQQCTIHIFEDLSFNSHHTPLNDFDVDETGRTALILYTSGTTGNPKGVMLSFQNIITNLVAVCDDLPIFTSDDRVMILLPLHHILPLVGSVVAPLYSKGTMVLNTSLAAEDIMATLQNFAVSVMIGVPRLYQLIYKGLREKIRQSMVARLLVWTAGKIGSRSLSLKLFRSVHKKFGGHIRYLVSGGAPIDKQVVSLFKTLGFELLEGYGMTETAPMITFTRPGKILPGVPGHLLPGMEIRFDDGEIVVKGRNVMQGYYNKPKETAEVLKDGWLYTGDLGFQDKEGYIHITGRKKEIIVMPSGKNINPEEVERELLKYSAYVKECGVFLKDGILQAIILPDFYKLKSDHISNIDQFFRWEVIDKLNKIIPSYKKILKFHITAAELPKTRLGKVKRFMLPELATERKERAVNEPKSKEYQALKKFLEEETQQEVHPDDHIELDLAIDSLGRVSLSAFIETAFGVEVHENRLADFESVLRLAEYIHSKKTRLNFDGISWSQILKEKVHINLPETWITHNMFKHLSQVFFGLFLRLKAKGLDNLPDQACIIAPNHQSVLDGFLVTSLFKRKFMKNTYVFAKEKHFRGPFLKFLANRNNIILVDINKDLKLSIQKLAEVLKKGKNLLIFPEGTRTLNGNLGEFKQTFAILSQELKIPVVPVAIKGSYDVLPSGARFPRLFRQVTVEFLKPVYPENHSYESLRKTVHQHLANHLGD